MVIACGKTKSTQKNEKRQIGILSREQSKIQARTQSRKQRQGTVGGGKRKGKGRCNKGGQEKRNRHAI